MAELVERIQKKEAVVGIIGLGYVGLPLLIQFGKAGLSVIGFDIDTQKNRCVASPGKLYQAYSHRTDQALCSSNTGWMSPLVLSGSRTPIVSSSVCRRR